MAATLSPEQIGQLVYNQFSNPFDYLGPHEVGSNGSNHWTVRAVFPNAESVVLIDLDTQTPHPMERSDLEGCEGYFEFQFPPRAKSAGISI